MKIYDALFSAMFNILSIYINIRVIKLFLPAKITKRYVTLPIYAGVWLCNWLLYYFLNIQNLTTLSLFVGLLIVSFVIFEGSAGKKITVVTVSTASCIIAENIVWEMCNRGLLPVESEPAGGLCAVTLEFFIILLIEKYVRFDRYTELPEGSFMNMILLSGGSVVLSEIIALPKHSDDMVMFGLGIICLMNVSTYYVYEKISESHRQNMERAAMEQQVKMYAKQFEVIGQSQENLKALRHDMNNHITLINTYLQNKEYEVASKYAEQFSESINSIQEYVRTGNISVDSILNYKLERIERDVGCKPEIEISVPDQSFMSDFDLNILLGNLLDNAAEALRKVEDKYLSIKLVYARGALYISIYNSFNGKIRRNNQMILSSKEDGGSHGIGLANVERIVNKYDGTMKIHCKEKLWGIDIIIYIKGVQT